MGEEGMHMHKVNGKSSGKSSIKVSLTLFNPGIPKLWCASAPRGSGLKRLMVVLWLF